METHNLDCHKLSLVIKIHPSGITRIQNNTCFVPVRLLYKLMSALKLDEYGIYLTTRYEIERFLELDL